MKYQSADGLVYKFPYFLCICFVAFHEAFIVIRQDWPVQAFHPLTPCNITSILFKYMILSTPVNSCQLQACKDKKKIMRRDEEI